MTMDFEGIAELADPTFTPFIKCFVLRIQQWVSYVYHDTTRKIKKIKSRSIFYFIFKKSQKKLKIFENSKKYKKN
jgi:hypothetical protein